MVYFIQSFLSDRHKNWAFSTTLVNTHILKSYLFKRRQGNCNFSRHDRRNLAGQHLRGSPPEAVCKGGDGGGGGGRGGHCKPVDTGCVPSALSGGWGSHQQLLGVTAMQGCLLLGGGLLVGTAGALDRLGGGGGDTAHQFSSEHDLIQKRIYMYMYLIYSKFSDSDQKPWTIIRRFDRNRAHSLSTFYSKVEGATKLKFVPFCSP